MENPAALVPLKNVSFTFTESLDPSQMHRPFLSWPAAEEAIRSMARYAPENGRDRTGFRIEWTDGEAYEGQLEVARSMAKAPAPLSDHVRRALEFIAGRWRPEDMAEEEHRKFLAEGEALHPGKAAWAARILDGYALGGAS